MKGLLCELSKIKDWQLDMLCLFGLFGLWFVIRWILKLIFVSRGYGL